MHILLVGDTHGEVSLINTYAEMCLRSFDIIPDLCLHAGDVGAFDQRYRTEWTLLKQDKIRLVIPTYAVAGNHEDPAQVWPVMRGVEEINNFHWFKDGGEILTFNKPGHKPFTVMGVGGAPCVDRPAIKYPFDPNDYMVALKRWEEAGKPEIDILLTHEAPTGTGAIGKWMFGDPVKCGIPELRTLWLAVGPKLQLNGHYHLDHTYEEGGLKHRILPVAQAGVKLLNTETWEITDLVPHMPVLV